MSGLLKAGRSAGAMSLGARRTFHTTRIAREHFLDANAESFNKRVIDESASKPILVDFYAAVLTPLLKGVTGPDSGYDLMTLDVDQYPELAAEYKVSALPTVVAFKNGKIANKFVGFRPEAEVKKFLGLL